MSPLGKRYLGRKFYRLAQAAWAKHDQEAALRFIDCAIHFDPLDRAAIDLRVDIWNGNLTGQHTLLSPPMMAQQEMLGMPGPEFDPSSGVPEGQMFGAPGGPEAIPQGVPFKDPPTLNGAPVPGIGPTPSASPSQSGGSSSPNGTAPRKLENPSQGRPFPQDAQATPIPSAPSSQQNDTAVIPASLNISSGMSTTSASRPKNQPHPLDGNRISPWLINQLKESPHGDGASSSAGSAESSSASLTVPATSAH
jgi:hypothetical protein